MTVTPQEISPTVSDADLRSFVERAVASFRGRRLPLVELERKLYGYHSSFAIEELTAAFDGAARLQLIFKNLGPQGLLEDARQTRPQFVYHPSREIVVYRDILVGAKLRTATCYGTLIDSDRQRYWLLLEKVAGDELYKIGVFSKWCDVARWLATMHGRLASMAERHQHDTVLLRYDEEFCHLWINRAEHFVGRRASAGQRELSRAQIRKLADRCRQAVRSLCRMPVTIVHGEFYASNILIQQRGNQTRICPVDWEMAAIAPGLIDLAALIAGNWTQRQKQELARAYYDALASEKTIYGSFEDLWSALRICRLLLAVKWLGWSADWRAPAEHRSDWLAEAMQLAHADDQDHA